MFANKKQILITTTIVASILVTLVYSNYYHTYKNDNPLTVAVIDTTIDIEDEKIANMLWLNKDELLNDFDDDGNGYIDDICGFDFFSDCGINNCQNHQANQTVHAEMCISQIINTFNHNSYFSDDMRIMPIPIMGDNNGSTMGTIEKLKEAIKYAENNGASICNMSLSADTYDKELYGCMKQSNMLFIVAAGNGNGRGRNIDLSPTYPASFNLDNVITVAALDEDGTFNKNSNYGERSVDLAAFGGVKIESNNQSCVIATSFATARVTGFVATIAKKKQLVNPIEIRNALEDYTVANESLVHRVRYGKEIELYD